MRCASIDIGTNTTLLLVVEVGSKVKEIIDISRSPRLGQELNRTGVLREEAMDRTILCLESYKKLIEREGAEKVFVFGTWALREAKNSQIFVERVKERLGFETEILSEEKEAYYSSLSVLRDPDFEYQGEVIIDIGGGSTEFIYPEERSSNRMVSLPLGALKLKEAFIRNEPPEKKEISATIDYIEDVLKKGLRKEKIDLIGIGGTITNLGGILSGKKRFERKAVHGMKLLKEEILSVWEKMEKLDRENMRREFPSLEAGREDIIFCGITILKEIIDFFESRYVRVSTKGARYGIIYERVLKVQ